VLRRPIESANLGGLSAHQLKVVHSEEDQGRLYYESRPAGPAMAKGNKRPKGDIRSRNTIDAVAGDIRNIRLRMPGIVDDQP